MKKPNKAQTDAKKTVKPTTAEKRVLPVSRTLDTHVWYNQPGFDRAAYREASKKDIKSFDEKEPSNTSGWMLTRGSRGVLANRVIFNKNGVYMRTSGEEKVYGSTNALRVSDEKFKVELLTQDALVKLATAGKLAKRCRNKSNNGEDDFLIIGGADAQYFVGIAANAKSGKLRVVNMETTSRKSRNPSNQWAFVRDLDPAALTKSIQALKL